MSLRPYIALIEKYTAANSHLMRYLKNKEFDPYTYWNEIRIWFEENPDYIDLLGEKLGREFADADEVYDEDPEIFYQLPPEVQEEAAEWVTDWLMRHAPHEAPTYAHLDLDQNRLLPRTTWLVHFTDNPDEIAEHGFTIGVHDMNKLGLTTYFTDKSFEKSMGGYNFAFIADSRHAKWAASEHKYGRHAVLFQNSGVLTYHYADEEDQVIFNGEDVDPRSIIILHSDGSDWTVQARRNTRRYGSSLFSGEYETAVAWVEKNYVQYRRLLTVL